MNNNGNQSLAIYKPQLIKINEELTGKLELIRVLSMIRVV